MRLRFNPLIVGAYSVTLAHAGLVDGDSPRFQSPDCRGVFRHDGGSAGGGAGAVSRFNPLIVGAYSVTTAQATASSRIIAGFNPLIVGAYSVTSAADSSPRARALIRFNPLIVGAYSVTSRGHPVARCPRAHAVSIP